MKNGRYVKIWMKITAYLITAGILLGQSMVAMATGTQSQLSEENTQKSEGTDTQDTDITSGENVPTDDDGLAEEADESPESSETTGESATEEISAQIEDLETAQDDLMEIAEQKSILALVYLCNKYEVKDTPSKDGGTVVSVVSGQTVQIKGVDLDIEGNVWYKVSLYQKEKNYTGYIEKQYLATSDEEFLDWTDEYIEEEQISAHTPKTMSILALSDYPDVNQFPASYQNALLALKQKYPNWIFVKMETGLNFNSAVSQELGDKSWISNSQPASWRDGAAAQSGWSIASEGILRYYMDPRNFLTESTIFQFEQLTYNESYHTENAVQAIIANSFMSGEIPGEDMTYAKAFTKIGEELKISPFHLASRVLQEQGTKGTSQLISGTYGEYAGYYNYFNVGASGKDIELIVNGLKEAQKRGWDTRYKSLYGGASVIGQNYILRGQDTLYLQKFNVTSNNTYNHQYMQNIQAPASEAPSIQKAYSNTGALNNSFVFKIPVYSNMPASACSQPDKTDVITLNKSTISSLAVDKTEKLIPYVNGSKPDNVNDMTFTSNNMSVATVDAQGVIKAISPGTAVITCTRSGASGAACTVTVVKAEPVVDTPVLSPVVYKKGLKLADISLPTGWAWSDQDTVLEAGTASYPAVYTPDDTTRYLTITKQIGLKVSQAIPSCAVPENLTAKIGSTLSSIALPEGFIWESDAETILDQAGEQTFYLSYYPTDTNYFELLHIPVLVKVIDDKTEPEEANDQGGTLPGGDTGNSSTGSSGNGNSGSGTGSSGSGSSGSGTGSSGNGNSGSGTGSSGNSGSGSSTGSSDNGSSGSGTESSGGGNDSGVGDSDSGTGGTGSDSTAGSGSTTGSSGSTAGSGSTTGSSGSTTGGSGSTAGSGSTTGSSGSTAGSGSTTGSSGSTGNSQGAMSSNSSPAGSNRPSGSDSSPAGSSDSAASGDSGIIQSGDNIADNNSATSSDEANNAGTAGSDTAGNDTAGNTGTAGSDMASNTSTAGSDVAGSRSTGTGSNSGSSGNRVIAGNSNRADNNNTLPVSEETEMEEIIAEPIYERPAVAMDMEDISVLTEEMLQIAKEQNIDLILTMNNRAKWHVNASAAKGGFSDIDMGVLFENGVIPKELLENTAEGNEYLEFSLAHDGPFGFIAELEIALNPEDCGRYANLFYFDSEAETLDFICASIIDENGYARFSMEHASCYVIIISDNPMTGIVADSNSGTHGIKPLWIILGALILTVSAAGAGGYLFWRKRQEDEEDGEEEYAEEDEEISDEEEYDKEDEEDYVEENGEVCAKEEYAELDEQDIAKKDKGEVAGKELQVLSIEKVVHVQYDQSAGGAEDDWIEDEDWQEPEKSEDKNPYADDGAEDDWIEDDEWDISNDWMDDEEWAKKNSVKKTAV